MTDPRDAAELTAEYLAALTAYIEIRDRVHGRFHGDATPPPITRQNLAARRSHELGQALARLPEGRRQLERLLEHEDPSVRIAVASIVAGWNEDLAHTARPDATSAGPMIDRLILRRAGSTSTPRAGPTGTAPNPEPVSAVADPRGDRELRLDAAVTVNGAIHAGGFPTAVVTVGHLMPAAALGLDDLGLHELAGTIEQVLGLFPGGRLPAGSAERSRAITVVNQDEALDDLSDAYLRSPEIDRVDPLAEQALSE